ncbi:hypothetical protein AAC387_Pa07g1270 [Persea americana]
MVPINRNVHYTQNLHHRKELQKFPFRKVPPKSGTPDDLITLSKNIGTSHGLSVQSTPTKVWTVTSQGAIANPNIQPEADPLARANTKMNIRIEDISARCNILQRPEWQELELGISQPSLPIPYLEIRIRFHKP